MGISIVSYNNFSKSVGNYIITTGAGEFNLPRQDMDALYGPSWPIAPVTRPEDSGLPREFDYPVGVNYTLQPRIGYEGLMPVRALKSAYINVPEVANPLLMLIRESCAFTPQIRNKKTKQLVKGGHPLLWMTDKPDGETPFNVWLTRLKKSSKIYAAPALYKKMEGGKIVGLEYIDGSTFFLIINSRGKLPNPDEVDPELLKYVEDVKNGNARGYLPSMPGVMKSADYNSPAIPPDALEKISDRFVKFELKKFLDRSQKYIRETGKPLPTTPAYTQIIKGLPFSFWDKNQIYFLPEPPSSTLDSPYGESYIERAWPSISLVALLWAFELGHYRTGNMPEGLITISKDIAPSLGRLATIEKEFNARMAEGTQTQHSRVRFMFDGSKWFQTKRPDFPKEQYQTANRNILLALGMPPKEMGDMPQHGLGGKGFEEGAAHDVTRQILEADKRSTEDIMNAIMEEIGDKENEFYLDYPVEEIDPTKQREQLDQELIHGEKSLNDVLTEQDKQPIGQIEDEENPANWHIVYMGGVAFVMEKLKVNESGIAQPQLTKPQPGGSPAGPETAIQQQIGRGHNDGDDKKLLDQTRQHLEESMGKSMTGITYFLPINKELGVGAGYGGYNLEGGEKKGGNGNVPDGCDPEEFAIGMREEQEHAQTVGGDQNIVRHIVMDHLREDPHYYTHLQEAGMVEKRYKLVGDKVINEDTGKLVPGGDHSGDHAAAVRHLQALYENVPDARKGFDKVDIEDHDGAMVAVMIPDKVASQLRKIAESMRLPDDAEMELPENMHITLAYFPDTDIARENREKILTCIKSAALGFGKLTGKIQGYGMFNGKDGKHVVYASLDAPDLPGIRQAITEKLDDAGIEYSKDHGFTPHITLAYFPDDYQIPKGFSVPDIQVSIEEIALAFGNKFTMIPLEGSGGVEKFMKVDWDEYFKHCGVCPEDSEYFGAPIKKTNVNYPNDHHANKNMEWVSMQPEGLKPLPALWKAEGDEKESLNEKIGGHQCPREEVAWLIDQSLGFHLVPVAYTSELDGERGVVLWYVDGPPTTNPKPADQYAPEWIEKVAVLDYIISNLDRPNQLKNYLTHPDDPKRLVAIDNGFSLPVDKSLYTESVFAQMMLDKPLSVGTLTAIKSLLADHSTWRDIQDVLTDWDNKDNALAAIAKAKECAQRLINEKSITSYTEHHKPDNG